MEYHRCDRVLGAQFCGVGAVFQGDPNGTTFQGFKSPVKSGAGAKAMREQSGAGTRSEPDGRRTPKQASPAKTVTRSHRMRKQIVIIC